MAAFLAFVTSHADDVAAARAVALTTVMSGGLALVWAERAGDRAWWRVPRPRERRFWLVTGAVALAIPLLFAVPPLAALVRVAPLSAGPLLLAIGLGVAAIAWRAPGAPRRRAP